MSLQHKPAALALLAALAVAPGCSVIRYAHLVCIEEPKLFCEHKDDKASLATYRSWADQAWAEQGAACPAGCLEGDYAWGFREGFAQFVYAGGDGQPPAAPPRPYWQLDLRTVEGKAAVDSWFAGYREGARVAREGGYRRCATLKLSASLKDCDPCGCPDETAGGCLGACELPTPGPTLSEPVLEPVPYETAPAPELAAPGALLELPSEDAPPLPTPTIETTLPQSEPNRSDSNAIFRIVN